MSSVGRISDAISPPPNHNLPFASLREVIPCFGSVRVAQLESCFPHNSERDASSKSHIFNMRNNPRLKLNFHKNPQVCIWSHLLQKNS